MANSQKKWFIHYGDRQDGPFAVDEIQKLISQGSLKTLNHAWCEGMPQWKRISDIEELRNPGSVKRVSESATRKTGNTKPPLAEMSALFEIGVHSDETSGDMELSKLMKAKKEAAQAFKIERKAEALSMPRPPAKTQAFKGVIFVAIAVATAGGYYWVTHGGIAQITSAPQSETNARPEPVQTQKSVKDLTPESETELNAAAKANLATDGARAAIAMSTAHPEAPVFYVATNLPGGVRLELTIHSILSGGAPGQDVSTTQMITTGGRLLNTEPAKGLAPGEYYVFVRPGDKQAPNIQKLIDQAPEIPQLPATIAGPRKVLAIQKYKIGAP